jgi:serine/threonine protein kinase
LLKKDFIIRLGDFGLARRTKEDGYFFDNGERRLPLPFRHTAPESLQTYRFSTQSELWAFGVVLWEIFTLAQSSPYAMLKERERNSNGILAFLDSGQRLTVPKYAPIEMCEVFLLLIFTG